jgi:hypothetical protein
VRAFAVTVALLALVAAGCGSGTGEEEASPPSPATETAPTAEASNRPPAPEIAGTSLEGEPISLADYRGRPVFVNVWSSW